MSRTRGRCTCLVLRGRAGLGSGYRGYMIISYASMLPCSQPSQSEGTAGDTLWLTLVALTLS